ncbi:MAG: protein kinase [Candidatus Acidiferrum sp.]|jgi:serine/threonine protein kinase
MDTIVKAGRYEILSELGRGAMGVVYLAIDPVIGRNVAVKTIRLTEAGTGLTRPELLSRFQTEARAAGLLTHPNIVVVYDAGEEDGLYYITMELVPGKSMQAVLDSGEAFPVSRILRILEQTCSALQFAHERNIVHRDIKPANLMLTADDTVKVTDFGTAKILQFGTVQQTTHVMGTPSYMSPEQVKGRPIDGRTDIFSLGVVLYEMLTGEKPFPGQSITTVIYKIVNEDPTPPRQLNPSIHPGLNEIVMRALTKDPDARYQSCREMLEDLRNYRALGGNDRNPDATLVSPRGQGIGQPFSTPTSPLRTPRPDELSPASTPRSPRSLQQLSPLQTPTVRRTGPLAPIETTPEKKTSAFTTMLAAIFLIAVIAYGVVRLRPEFQAARARNNPSAAPATVPSTPTPTPTLAPAPKQEPANNFAPATENSPPPATPAAAVPTAAPNDSANNPPPDAGAAPQPQPTAEKPVAAPPAEKKIEPSVTPGAAQYKRQIEEAIADKGLTGRVKVSATANTLMLVGKLRPAEHGALLKFMRNAPSNVRVVDDIQYDDTPIAGAEHGENGAHPVPDADKSAIHVVTDVIGATATLFGPAGRQLSDCQTPCSFNNLAPTRYSLQVTKDGYSPVQTALALKSDQTLDQKLHLEAIAKGLFITSTPAGADIFINGAKQSGKTPATLPLSQGQYDLVLRVQGYQAYAGHVVVKDNQQTAINAQLQEKSPVHVAWAQVQSNPEGAEIFIDGVPTGEITPARVQIPTGPHIIALKLKNFQIAKRGVEASEGGTVLVKEDLRSK